MNTDYNMHPFFNENLGPEQRTISSKNSDMPLALDIISSGIDPYGLMWRRISDLSFPLPFNEVTVAGSDKRTHENVEEAPLKEGPSTPKRRNLSSSIDSPAIVQGFLANQKIVFPNGDVYEGGILNNQFHGYGKVKFINGTISEGHYENGLLNGEGSLTDAKGRVYYRGGFKNGKYEGQGTLTFTDGSSIVGHFHEGIAEGQGIANYPDGKIFRGIFKDGKPHSGSLTRKNGTLVFEGQFKNGRPPRVKISKKK